MKVRFETFGCRLNRAEALAMQAGFESRGWETVGHARDADLIVVRGCSVTGRAQRDCEKFIDMLKRSFPMKRLVVTGCMKEKKNEFILKDVPKNEIPMATSRAYLKVQDGCSGGCTFCTVPRFRGRPVSEPFEEVVEKARRFIDAGYREIVVTGCNLSLYDFQGRRFPDLVAAVADAAGENCRVRIGSLEPGETTIETLHAMAGRANICRHLHLAVQSGSQKILKAMGRSYDVSDVEKIVAAANELMPGIAVGCDMIAGFPGETVPDHYASMSLARKAGFVKGHIFKYSERPGTPAAEFPGEISGDIRSKRAHEIAGIIDANRVNAAKKLVGQTVRIVVEDASSTGGWTDGHFWCSRDMKLRPENAIRIRRREFADMRVTGTSGHALVGVVSVGR